MIKIENIGKRIREIRKNKNMTMLELGNRVGTTENNISRYERGVIKDIPLENINKIAEALETNVYYLLTGDKPFDVIGGKMNLEIFNYEGKKVRTQIINDEPWFVGKDVAIILGYQNPRDALNRHVDVEDKKDGVVIHDSIGREQTPTFINESGLYSLILSSKLEGAKKFKRWVTNEVLPSIRKTGMYATNEKLKEMETEITELKNSNPVSRLIKEIQQANINLSCAEIQSSVRESSNSVTTTTTVRLYPERTKLFKPINLFEM